MPSPPAFAFFFGHDVGANGTAAQEGSNEFLLLTKYCGGCSPETVLNLGSIPARQQS